MEKLVLRGSRLLRRPLHSACTRMTGWGRVSLSQPRLAFSCSSRLAADPAQQSRSQLQSPKNRTKLPDTPCRTRFAPSPTGYLHLGSLRTALFNYLLARATGGQFILRIEDTDQTRLVPDAEERLYKDLRWAGLSWDEGPNIQGPYGPYRQSERLPLYQEHADKLVREGKAYRCFCSPEALEEHKKAAHESGQPTLYPGTCRNISLEESDDRAHRGEEFAIRFKSAEEPLMIQDIIYSRFKKKDPEDDYVIMKRDGFPTYHFANVVDDRHMKITHVVRGAEWLVSTPKHVELYKAFDWEPPQFAHLGLLVEESRQKLSKRNNTTSIEYYQNGHILPTALLNFAVLLGWRAPPTKGDVMTLDDMVKNFSLQFSKGDIVVSLQKLPFLQEKHLQRLVDKEIKTIPDVLHLKRDFLRPIKAAIDRVQRDKDDGKLLLPGKIGAAEIGPRLPVARILEEERFHGHLARLVLATKLQLQDPANRFVNALWKMRYYIWEVPEGALEMAVRDGLLEPVAPADRAAQLAAAVAILAEKFGAVDEASWDEEGIARAMKDVMADKRYWACFETTNAQKNLYTPLRWALMGLEKGLPVSTTMEILGREETLRRLAVAKIAAEKAAVPMPESFPQDDRW